MTAVPMHAPAPRPAASVRNVPGLRVLGSPPPPPAGTGPAGFPAVHALSPRERQVLLLMTEGLSNREIAGRLFVSEATVKSHVARVLVTLGVRDRLQAVVVAFRAGLVPVDVPRPVCPCCT